MYGLWGFWGARYQSLRALIGRDASQPGQWATSVMSTKNAQKGWITRGGGQLWYPPRVIHEFWAYISTDIDTDLAVEKDIHIDIEIDIDKIQT